MQWRKSTHSGGANDEHCVELGRLAPGTSVGVRDSKNPDAGRLTLTVAQLSSLLDQIKQDPAH
ncbi:DUF397 domain-containing protein [Actinomadura sp. 9N215]|uniref:DUF397 domain-containing protein n=1 Tax=Actinomadura sp. 9N215 TaxID=3375150 RepID=UPI0037BEC7B0